MPVTETLFYYTEDDFKIPSIDERKMLVFMRSCDVHGLHRIDNVYLKNGSEPDFYYKRGLEIKLKLLFWDVKKALEIAFV